MGLKIQHALRAFTAKDRKAIKLAAENYPISEHYEVKNLLTELGIGEALVTALNEKGIPTPLAHTMLRAPQSRMDVLTDAEIKAILKKSSLLEKYNEEIDRESAYEMLSEKIEIAQTEAHQEKLKKQKQKGRKSSSRRSSERSFFDQVINNTTTRQIGRTVARELTRGLLSVFGIETDKRRRRR